MVRGLLNLEIGSWPAKPIDAGKAFKWQTRRLGKIQSPEYTELGVSYIGHATKGEVAQATYRAFPDGGTARWAIEESPFGVPGDHLWARETFSPTDFVEKHPNAKRGFSYRADWNIEDEAVKEFNWRPSIHMPRWASRITLEVMEVRVQRLQEISEEDAIAEGVKPIAGERWIGVENKWGTAKMAFRELWDSIYGVKHPWASNPWTWIYSFKRIK